MAARGACANRLSEPVYPYGRAYPAGGIVDIATRIVTDKLSEIWHQPIVVEAKPGASGNLAWDQVSRAEPELLCKVRILKLHFDRPRAAQSHLGMSVKL